MDFEDLDKVLDQVEPAFTTMISRYRLLRSRLERWRGDEPKMTLTWLSPHDDIHRNVSAFIEEPEAKVIVEVNAWQDRDEQFGRVRRWKHETVATLPVSFSPLSLNEYELGQSIEIALKTVTGWTRDSLQKAHALRASP